MRTSRVRRIARSAAVVAVVAAFACLAAVGPATAADGDLDGTFGDSGIGHAFAPVRELRGSELARVQVSPLGGYVAFGAWRSGAHPRLARFGATGALTTSFGTGGLAMVGASSADREVRYADTLAVDSAGRSIIAAPGPGWISLARYTAGGALDSTFLGDGAGYVSLLPPAGHPSSDCWYTPTDISEAAAGSIVISGGYYCASGGVGHWTIRRLANGSPDTTFNGNGEFSLPMTGVTCAGGAATDGPMSDPIAKRLTNGDIVFFVIVQRAVTPPYAYCAVYRRINADGTPDPTGGTTGAVLDVSNIPLSFEGATIGASGAIIAADSLFSGGLVGFRVVRLAAASSTLSADVTFSGDGVAEVGYPLDSRQYPYLDPTGLIEAPDRSIMIFGSRSNGSGEHMVASRLTSTGSLDTSMGTAGLATLTGVGIRDAYALGGTLDADGSLVLAGSARYCLPGEVHGHWRSVLVRLQSSTSGGPDGVGDRSGARCAAPSGPNPPAFTPPSTPHMAGPTPFNDRLSLGKARDVIHLLSGNDRAWGNGGNDQLFGDAGNDRLWGGPGNDLLDGGSGNDSLAGGAGNDVQQAGSGNDHVRDHSGRDIVSGGVGPDIIDVRGGKHDGVDVVLCGPGRDKVIADPDDIIAADCERVRRG